MSDNQEISLDLIKSSVRLPKTDFAIKANFSNLQSTVLEAWNAKDIYALVMEKYKSQYDDKSFILHDGSPYANGHIHAGHAVNKILKDVIVKAHFTLGYYAPFVLGWDCHGLPIEWKIEEEYKSKGLSKDTVDVIEFRKACRDFANFWVSSQSAEFNTLGIIADFAKPYLTADNFAEASIVKSIHSLLTKGYLYQGKKPVMFSIIEQTALAEAEIEYHDKKSDTVYVGLKINSFKDLWQGAYAVIWTTTPWTLPANQALAYNSKITYGLYEVMEVKPEALVQKNTKIVLAEDLSARVFEALGIIEAKKLDTSIGLSGMELEHPLYNLGYKHLVKALSGDFVETEVGTGLVHIAPSHGEDDFYLAKKANITPIELISDNGIYIDSVPIFAGVHVFKVNPLVIEKLKENGNLFAHNVITHSYPHSWRSKAPLIYKLTTQWFINLKHNNIREKALSAIETVDFVPATGRNRLRSMVANRPDWVISRQRTWGVPLALFVHKVTKEPIVDSEVFERIFDAFMKNGSDAWFNTNKQDFLGDKYNIEDYDAVSDVVDVWMDSGLTQDFVLKGRSDLKFPADLYLEGSDQHRGWFQSSLLMSLLVSDEVPFKKILTHGFVLDEKNQKMSKSLGNIITPKDMIEKYGADIVRLWVVNSNYTDDLSLGKNVLAQQEEIYRKIRNTLRYLLSNSTYFTGEVDYKDYSEIDKWVLHHVYLLDVSYEETFRSSLAINHFYSELFQFINFTLSSFYFDTKKDTLYCDSSKSKDFKATISVINILLNFMFKWLSPVLPFTIEEVYAKYNKSEVGSLFLHHFITANKDWKNEDLENKFSLIKKIRKVVMSAIEERRAAKEIGSSLEASIVLYLPNAYINELNSIDLANIMIVSHLEVENLDNIKDKNELFSLAEIAEVYVKFSKHAGEKCQRCWKYYDKLEENSCCSRCNSVMKEVI